MFVKYMLGVRKNLPIQCRRKNFQENKFDFCLFFKGIYDRYGRNKKFHCLLKNYGDIWIIQYNLVGFDQNQILYRFHLIIFYRRNVRDGTNLTTCRYNKDSDPYCPIFRIGYVLDGLNTNLAALLRDVNEILSNNLII